MGRIPMRTLNALIVSSITSFGKCHLNMKQIDVVFGWTPVVMLQVNTHLSDFSGNTFEANWRVSTVYSTLQFHDGFNGSDHDITVYIRSKWETGHTNSSLIPVKLPTTLYSGGVSSVTNSKTWRLWLPFKNHRNNTRVTHFPLWISH